MNKKIYLIPLLLATILFAITWGCKPEEQEDVCEAFDLVAKVDCDVATICCPIDDGNCYITNPDGGENFYCDKTKATPSDPDGCSEAEAAYIATFCTKGITKEQEAEVRYELQQHFKQLMTKARHYSVCI